MATAARRTAPPAEPLELHSGDRMTRAEFHRIYEQTPSNFKAELVGGIVYVASPLRYRHGTNNLSLGLLFSFYMLNTPGVEAADNTTILLGEEGEPQPDLFLRILSSHGGQSSITAKDYVKGPPELLAEIAYSSRSLDLHGKRLDYARYGVLEYLVWCVREQQLHWFDLRADQELTPDADGVIRIRSFPGLWIDVEAVLHKDPRMMAVLNQGLATPEHAAFVRALAETASRQAGSKRKKASPRRRRKPHGERGGPS